MPSDESVPATPVATASGDVARSRPRSETRGLGTAVFLIGVLMLVATFLLTLGAYWSARGADADLTYLPLAAQFAFLIVLAYAASLVASKGIELYAAGRPRDSSMLDE